MVDFHNDYDDGMDSGYFLPFRLQGTTTSPQTPNQITELGLRLNTGMKNVEIGVLDPKLADNVPISHMVEMARLAKLTDSKISIHAPLIDPAGFTEQAWSEDQRRENEIQFKSIVDRAHMLDPEGNTPVTIHTTTGTPEGIWTKVEGKPKQEMMVAVEQETGRMVPLRYEKVEYIEGPRVWTPEDRLRNLNENAWDEQKLRALSYQKAMQELDFMNRRIQIENPTYLDLSIKEANGAINNDEKEMLNRMRGQIDANNIHIRKYNDHLISALNDMNDKFKRYAFDDASLTHEQKLKKKEAEDRVKELRDKLNLTKESLDRIKEDYDKGKISKTESQRRIEDVQKTAVSPNLILGTMADLPAPQLYKPADDFAREKAAETFSNLALHAYKKYGDKAPIISMENVFPGMVLSRAESVREAVKESRELFVNKLIQEKKIKKEEAEKIAEKIIGVTWDVSHINLLRKQGFEKEDIVKEAREIAPYVKHLHIADNFGHSDSHLAPGMGNVPIKEELEEIEKKLGKEVRHIVEAGAFAGQFKASPIPYQLKEFNSPLYSYENHPTWGELRNLYASYLVGYGEQFLPEQGYQMYGAGFSANIPRELGGQHPGTRSRFAGTPNI